MQGHKIVPAGSSDATKRVSYNRLVLTACHPLYSAKQRIIVFARLTKKEPLRVAARDDRPAGPVADRRADAAARMRERLTVRGKRVLGRGMKCPDVKALQRLLGLPQTGVYDSLTEFAVRTSRARTDSAPTAARARRPSGSSRAARGRR